MPEHLLYAMMLMVNILVEQCYEYRKGIIQADDQDCVKIKFYLYFCCYLKTPYQGFIWSVVLQEEV